MPIYNRHFVDEENRFNPRAMAVTGPVLQVQVEIPSVLAETLGERGEEIPDPVSGQCLIDTGASRTAVDAAVLESLNLQPQDVTTVGTGAGRVECGIYTARLAFPQENMTLEGAMLGVDLSGQTAGGQPLAVLLGRDVLSRALLVYNGIGGYFTFAIQ